MTKKIVVETRNLEAEQERINSYRENRKKMAVLANGQVSPNLMERAEELFWKQVAMTDNRDILDRIGMPELGTEIEVTF